PPPSPRSAAAGGSLLRMPGVPVVIVAFIAIGCVFGSVDVATVAAADAEGRRAAAGIVLGVYAFGSMLSALVLGSRSQSRDDASLPRFLLLATVALAVVTVPLIFVSGLVAIGFMVLLAGLTVSPVLITGFTLIERLVATTRLTEGLTWATSGIGLGVALSAALSGWLVDTYGIRAGFVVTAVAALVTLAITTGGYRVLVRGIRAASLGIADNPRRT
ncbi:MAG: MFS transporter, partial [Actinomycetota bacterium]